MKVIFSIDTEHETYGIPYRINGNLSEFGITENYGIYRIMDLFEKHKSKAVFFVNVYEAGSFDSPYENYIDECLKDIHSRGHEVGLHCHLSKSEKFKNKKALSYLSKIEQLETISSGLDYIQSIIDYRPISFRAGAYRINDETLDALDESGILFDSSYFYDNRKQEVSNYRTINKSYKYKNLYEIPVFTVIDNNKKQSKLDLDWLKTNEEIIQILYNCKKCNYEVVTIMFHSFSLLKEIEDESDSVLFKCGNRNYIGGDKDKIQKLDYLLSYLELSPDFQVTTFRDLDTSIFNNDISQDIIISTYNQASINKARVMNNLIYYSFEKGRIVNEVKENCKFYFDENKLKIECNIESAFRYTFYVIKDGDTIFKPSFSESSKFEYIVNGSGKYHIRVFLQFENDERIAFDTKQIEVNI